MFLVYVLRDVTSGQLYIGSSNNISRKMEEHEVEKPGYSLIYSELLTSKPEALKREKYLKSGSGRRSLKVLLTDKLAGVIQW